MTRLLVSVRSVAEAEAALAGGADLIDVKEPARGPLGRADDCVIRDVIKFVAERGPVSAALGEIEVATPAPLGLSFAKVGLANVHEWQECWQKWRASLPCPAVLVAYVDTEIGLDIMKRGPALEPPILLLDSAKKDGRNLLEHVSLDQLRLLGKSTPLALAGSLDECSIQQLLPLQPSIIAVRGAACDGGRNGYVSEQRVARLARLIRLAHVDKPS